MKKAFVALLLLALMSMSLMAQIPSGYYDNASGKTGDELKTALHEIIKDHNEVTYSGLLNAFAYTDCKANGKIWDIYSNYEYSLNQNGSSFPAEGAGWNREHTWPQSWFNEQTTPRCDLFHVYPTDGYVNNCRSNHPYGEVNHPTYTSGNGSKLGPCVTSGYSGTVFEPIDEYKGDIARSYFYMSVRYYLEDSGWSTSDMTNKSVILPWAMTMLLRWSDEDPVSDKETARNNAVYGYQNNRNPFIDHPEYAHMIWDPNWSGMPYAITCATGLSNGSISAPSQAVGGTIVTLTATPAQGYMLGNWNVYKTGDANTTIPVSANGTFTMPSFNVTVSATFTQNNTAYNITCVTGLAHGSISTSVGSAQSGTPINLSHTPASGYVLYSYYVYKTGDVNTIVYSGTGNSFVMPAYDVTVSASFVQPSSYSYAKVTSTPSDWSGEYVLVYENSATSAYVWTGVDAASCYTEKTITNNSIADDGMVSITIASVTGGYSIKVNGGTNNGKYIKGTSGSNALGFDTNPALNTLSCESDGVKITSNTSVMRYNNTTNNNRFRYFKSSTYISQQPVQLYKKTGTATAPTHTIQFNPNGASGTNYTQTVNEFEPTALQANDFTYEGYAFDSWNTATNGSGTTYFDGATVSLLGDLTLYAQWAKTYPISLAQVENGSISTGGVTEAVEGAEVTLTATPNPGYEFDYWLVTTDNESVEVEGNSFIMPGCAVTVSAVFVYVGAFAQQYYLVTSTDQLVAGRTYLIVNTNAGKAMGTSSSNGNNRTAVDVTIADNVISSLGNACELTLGSDGNYWTLFDANWGTSGGYLYAASSSSNYLKTQASYDDNGKWSISFASNGVATIQAQGTYTRNVIKYNSGNNPPIFSCYSSSNNNMQNICLFIRSEEYNHTQNETIARIFPFDKHTVQSGVTLTVTGSVECINASHLVLEDGAQLVHTGNNVQATVKKTVAAYSGDGGWYTIAVPFAAYTPTGTMVDNDYDLYAYDEDGDSNGKEWINYKAGAFNLVQGQGYLYAHNPGTTLRMEGTLNSGNYSQVVNLCYASNNADLRGFNLLGNPTAHSISYTKTTGVSDGYYYLSNNESWVYAPSNTVPAGRGFMVKANASTQRVTLNPQSKDSSEDGQYLCFSIGEKKAYVKLNEGVSMPLLSLKGEQASLYLTRDGKRYVMLVRNGASTLDLGYVSQGNGMQTLEADLGGLDINYLHLIDNLTGADVDLLQTPQYSFNATADDPGCRFRLAFSSSSSASSQTDFAYFDGSEWVIKTDGDAILQVVDMMGRVVVSRNVTNRFSTRGIAPGVYFMRLINDSNVRTQKIVVK